MSFNIIVKKNNINVIELEYGENIICKIQAIPEEKRKNIARNSKKNSIIYKT